MFSGQLVVRGSAPEDTTIFVEGVDVPLVYHFGGVSSVIPTELLEKIDFYPANYSSVYGRGMGGMVDVGLEDRIDVDELPELRAGVAVLGGEARARHIYAMPGAAGDVLASWREVLGDRAWVMSRDEAIKEGWFGPVDPSLADRIGDVVAAPAGSLAIVATKAEPRESALTGMHGSLTSADQFVPALSSSVL